MNVKIIFILLLKSKIRIRDDFSKQSRQKLKNHASKNILLINLQFSQKQSRYFLNGLRRMVKYFYVGHSKIKGID